MSEALPPAPVAPPPLSPLMLVNYEFRAFLGGDIAEFEGLGFYCPLMTDRLNYSRFLLEVTMPSCLYLI